MVILLIGSHSQPHNFSTKIGFFKKVTFTCFQKQQIAAANQDPACPIICDKKNKKVNYNL